MSLNNMDTTEVAEDPIERFSQKYAANDGKSESTAERYATHLRRWRDWLEQRGKDIEDVAEDVNAREADGVTAYDVVDHLEAMSLSGYAENTANGAWAAISTFYQTLREFRQNPADSDLEAFNGRSWSATTQIEKSEREKVKYLPPEDIEALVEHVPSPVPRNALIVRLLYATGLRRGELCNLRVKDINRDEQRVS
ncbi:tyrosine-type recombinase/integrase [Halosimplex aquaticum]|uniref:Tyrosine-type recombinase/integrase n=1 Tax=Halosimplex aquaticum TaxID=3026162 RepID=A0ABD5Y241_9EURY|nr:tyrosine-type recombinase/integrase [Halosimplex aquaticum]